MTAGRLPPATRQRLELLRLLLDDLESLGRDRVTSRDLGRWLGTTPDSVRKDLSGSGPGTPGAAYDVADLRRRLDELLDPPRTLRRALVGLGDLGLALAQGPQPFVVGFDGRTNRLEQADLPFPLFPTTEIVAVSLRMEIDVAVLAVGAQEVQRIAERFLQAGVRRLVNYSPAVLRVDRHKIEVWERGFPV